MIVSPEELQKKRVELGAVGTVPFPFRYGDVTYPCCVIDYRWNGVPLHLHPFSYSLFTDAATEVAETELADHLIVGVSSIIPMKSWRHLFLFEIARHFDFREDAHPSTQAFVQELTELRLDEKMTESDRFEHLDMRLSMFWRRWADTQAEDYALCVKAALGAIQAMLPE